MIMSSSKISELLSLIGLLFTGLFCVLLYISFCVGRISFGEAMEKLMQHLVPWWVPVIIAVPPIVGAIIIILLYGYNRA